MGRALRTLHRRAAPHGADRRPQGCRGLATLATLLALLTLAAWAAASAQRAALNELRAAMSHARAAEAFEAAQGGLDWALALLQAGPLDAACLPASAPQPSLAERLAIGPVELACSRLEASWACQCPMVGGGSDDEPSAASMPTFRVVAIRPDPAGAVQLRAIGRGTGGAGQASLTMLAAPDPGTPPIAWRRVPGSWRDF